MRTSFHEIEPVVSDGRILQLDLPRLGISLRDFYLFSRGKLADMPKVLGLEVSIRKGFFPHRCLAAATYFKYKSYRGVIPELKYFEPDKMSAERRQSLLEWHQQWLVSGVVYDLMDEAVKYCIDDAEILRRAALKFRWIFLKLTSGVFDPLLHNMTIAQSAMTYYRLV